MPKLLRKGCLCGKYDDALDCDFPNGGFCETCECGQKRIFECRCDKHALVDFDRKMIAEHEAFCRIKRKMDAKREFLKSVVHPDHANPVSERNISIEIGREIQRVRRSKGMTVPELAKTLKRRPNDIKAFECGDRTPAISLLSKIAEALEVRSIHISFEGDWKNLKELPSTSLREKLLKTEKETENAKQNNDNRAST